MNVLIWTNAFPRFSETFIRDHIVRLIDNGLNVLIYSGKYKNFLEKDALKGFENYNLMDRVNDERDFIPKTWKTRKCMSFAILFASLFKGTYRYYRESLNKDKYGTYATSLRLFYYVHFLLKNNIKVIHTHFGTNGVEAAIFKRIGLPIKLITTFHGFDIRLGIEKGGAIYKPLFDYSDSIVAISDYNRRHLIEFGCDKSKLVNIPNGVDTRVFRKKSNSKNKGAEIKLLSVARLVEEKRLDIAINAVAALVKNCAKLHIEYRIIGDGPLRTEIQKNIDDLSLNNIVSLSGSKSTLEVRDAMLEADLFLLSSQEEVLPTVLLEAQACELPIVATKVGSVTDMVVGGYFVESNNAEAFTNGLLEAFNNRDKWPTLGIKGREFIEKRFNVKVMTKQILSLYND